MALLTVGSTFDQAKNKINKIKYWGFGIRKFGCSMTWARYLLSTDLCKIMFSYNFCKLFPSQRFTTIKVETTLEIDNLQYIFVCMCSGNVYLFILDKKSPKKLNIVRERVIFNIFLFACPSAIFTFLYWTKKSQRN